MIISQRIFGFHLLDMLDPLRMLFFWDHFQKSAENFSYISDHRRIYHNILIDFCRIDIDLQDLCLFCKGLGISCDTITETCAQNDQKVALCHTEVGSLSSMHTEHACIQRILSGKSSLTHQTVTNW